VAAGGREGRSEHGREAGRGKGVAEGQVDDRDHKVPPKRETDGDGRRYTAAGGHNGRQGVEGVVEGESDVVSDEEAEGEEEVGKEGIRAEVRRHMVAAPEAAVRTGRPGEAAAAELDRSE
jgi:hypothetical protein